VGRGLGIENQCTEGTIKAYHGVRANPYFHTPIPWGGSERESLLNLQKAARFEKGEGGDTRSSAQANASHSVAKNPKLYARIAGGGPPAPMHIDAP